MNAEPAALLRKADESLRAARLLLDKDFAGPAASEAYYAMFSAAKALLIGKGVRRHKHAGVIAAFGEHFAKTGLLPADLHRWMMAAEKDRLMKPARVLRPMPSGNTSPTPRRFYSAPRCSSASHRADDPPLRRIYLSSTVRRAASS